MYCLDPGLERHSAKSGDHLCPIGWRSPPGSFVGLMTLYESNYIRLGWILPDVRSLSGRCVSRVEQDPDLHLEVREQGRYTTMLDLTYRFDTGAGELLTPDMSIRVYHDARLAEAYSCTDSPARALQNCPLRRLEASLGGQLDRRWARNMLLNKWLDYCAERGHRF